MLVVANCHRARSVFIDLARLLALGSGRRETIVVRARSGWRRVRPTHVVHEPDCTSSVTPGSSPQRREAGPARHPPAFVSSTGRRGYPEGLKARWSGGSDHLIGVMLRPPAVMPLPSGTVGSSPGGPPHPRRRAPPLSLATAALGGAAPASSRQARASRRSRFRTRPPTHGCRCRGCTRRTPRSLPRPAAARAHTLTLHLAVDAVGRGVLERTRHLARDVVRRVPAELVQIDTPSQERQRVEDVLDD